MIRKLRRRVGGFFLRLLGRNEPAWEVALSFAIGVAISFSPFLGFHTLLALVVAWVFRLNKVDVLIGTYAPVNPWTMVPIYSTATALGWLLLGHSTEDLPPIDFRALVATESFLELFMLSHWRTALAPIRPYLSSFLLGSSLYSVLAGLLTYVGIVRLIERHRLRKADRAVRRAERRAKRMAELAARAKDEDEATARG